MRRGIFVLAAIVVAAGIAKGGGQPSLGKAARKLGILVGTAVDPMFFSQQDYAKTLVANYTMVEPENQMKWTATEPEQGKFDFKPGDAIVTFAEAHKIVVRGHNLLWWTWNPRWLTTGHFTPDQLRAIMRNHIRTVAKHYAGQVFAWDVVNEAFLDNGQLRPSIWYDKPGIGLAQDGTAYIAKAFRWAHAADPNALLFYNDYNAEGLNAKSDAIYQMVKEFKAEGVPIDGVGLQAHLTLKGEGVSELKQNIARFGALGVQVQITELDVRIPVNADGKPLHAGEIKAQADVYGRVAAACAAEPACTAFQTWGFTDRYSWVPGFTHGKDGLALPFNKNYQPTPAYFAILSAFKKARKDKAVIRKRRNFEKGFAR